MNKILTGTLILQVLILGVFILPAQSRLEPVTASVSDKYEADCTGHETVGHCADKCPNQTDTLIDFDPQTGAAICRQAPTGCPYGDSVPLGPECDKLEYQQPSREPMLWGGK